MLLGGWDLVLGLILGYAWFIGSDGGFVLFGACLGLGPWLGLLFGQGLTKVVGVE